MDEVCALRLQRPCCRGEGYVMEVAGGFARAKQCACVAECKLCRGTTNVISDGESRPCIRPTPQAKILRINNAGIPARYTHAELEGFSNFFGEHNNNRREIKKIWEWLNDFEVGRSRGLLLSGAVGVGKTYLLVAITKKLIAKNVNVRFIDFFQLLYILKDAFSRDRSELSVLDPLLKVDVLAIDEMGKGRNTSWEKQILDQLVMGRYNQNKLIVASTNYSLRFDNKTKSDWYTAQLDNNPLSNQHGDDYHYVDLRSLVGERTFSRLQEMTNTISLAGKDYRERWS